MLAQLAVLDSLPVPKDLVPEPVPVKQKKNKMLHRWHRWHSLRTGKMLSTKRNLCQNLCQSRKAGNNGYAFFLFQPVPPVPIFLFLRKNKLLSLAQVLAQVVSGTGCKLCQQRKRSIVDEHR